MDKILTLDLGTSYLKAGLFDRRGRLCALTRKPTPISHPSKGRCEMAPDRLRQAVKETLAELSRSEPGGLREVAAVTFATQSNSFLLLDGEDKPLTPLIIWADERARPMRVMVETLPQIAGFHRTTGIPCLGWEYMAAKLLWLRENQPEVWRDVRRLCLISDYLTYWLTGCYVTEAGVAGLTGTVDIRHLAWWPAVCEPLGLPPSWLPIIARAGTDLGSLRAEVAADLGLPVSCRFIVGCLDQYAGAIGVGCLASGAGSETTGTVLATVRCSDGIADEPANGVFQGPSFAPGMHFQMLFGLESANLLEWYRQELPDQPHIDRMLLAAAEVVPGADGLRLRPDAARGDVKEGFIGWDNRHTPAHAVRCIMEAVALALARQVEQLWGTEPPRVMRSSGGGARSEVWLQIKADLLNLPFESTTCPEPTSLGAAILAGQALGWGNAPELAKQWVRAARSFKPRPDVHKVYSALLQQWRAADRDGGS
jgi:xylulokinase